MIHNLSIQIADKIAAMNCVQGARVRILAYGIEVLLSSMGSIMILIVLSVCLGEHTAWVAFLLGLAPMRMTAGGYHAPTQGRCYILFAILYVFVVLFSKILPYGPLCYPWIASGALILVLFKAPIATHNKPLSPGKYERNRKCAIAIAAFNWFVALIAYLFPASNRFIQNYYLGVIAATILMVIALIKKQRKEDCSK